MEARANPKIETSGHSFAWKWMRYSAFLLIPLVYIHVILQDLIVGGHNLSLSYVQGRWALWGWRLYDIFLLAFAFSHGANGLRQVLSDYMKSERAIRWMSRGVAVFWLIVTLIGAAAIIGGVRMPYRGRKLQTTEPQRDRENKQTTELQRAQKGNNYKRVTESTEGKNTERSYREHRGEITDHGVTESTEKNTSGKGGEKSADLFLRGGFYAVVKVRRREEDEN